MDVPLSEAFIFLSFSKNRSIGSFSATHCKLKHPVGYGRFSEGNAQEGSGLTAVAVYVPQGFKIQKVMGEDNKHIIHKHLQTPWNFHEDKKSIKQSIGYDDKKNKKTDTQKDGSGKKKFSKKNFREGSLGRGGGRRGGWGVHRKIERKNGQNNALFAACGQTHTNDKKTRETAKKAAKKAIFFDKFNQCKRKRNEAKKRANKQNCIKY